MRGDLKTNRNGKKEHKEVKKRHKGSCITDVFLGSRSPRTLVELGRRCEDRNEGEK